MEKFSLPNDFDRPPVLHIVDGLGSPYFWATDVLYNNRHYIYVSTNSENKTYEYYSVYDDKNVIIMPEHLQYLKRWVFKTIYEFIT